jgi:hypothetical protein
MHQKPPPHVSPRSQRGVFTDNHWLRCDDPIARTIGCLISVTGRLAPTGQNREYLDASWMRHRRTSSLELSSAFFISLSEVHAPSIYRNSWGYMALHLAGFAVAYQRLSDTLEPEARQGIEAADNAAMVVLPACPQLVSSPGSLRVYYGNGVPWYWIIDANTLAIEEYQATPQGYLRTASVAPGEEFRPQLFPGLMINLQVLLGVEQDSSPSA